MEIDRALSDRRQSLLALWQKKMLEIYPADSARFYSTEKNAFANPVGQTITGQSAALLDLVLGGGKPCEVAAVLEPIIRIRAVQDFSPSVALAFVPMLKAVMREELQDLLTDPSSASELSALDARVDEVLLTAVDIYVHCREEVAAIRVRETSRHVSGLLRRFGVTESTNGEELAEMVQLGRHSNR